MTTRTNIASALWLSAMLLVAGSCDSKKADSHGKDDGHDHGSSEKAPSKEKAAAPGGESGHAEEGHKEGEEGHKEGEEGHTEGEEGEHGEEGHGDEGIVTLTPEQVKTARIVAAPAERRAVTAEITATAEVVPPEDGVARLGPKLPGRIAKLSAGLGDKVVRGQVLATIDSPELGRAKADFISAVTAAQLSRETADREKALFDKKISSERDWRQAEAEATRARVEKEAAEVRMHTLGFTDSQLAKLSAEDHQVSNVPVTSPIAGVVVERGVALGQMVGPEETMFVIMDLRKVWVLVDVYERDLKQVAVGQKVQARVQAWGDRVFAGTVQAIGATLDRRSRTIKVQVEILNDDGALKPGMFANVMLDSTKGEPREGLYVPVDAVQRNGDNAIVFIQSGETQFQLREVEVGQRTEQWVELLRGIAPGERVVTTGAFFLKSEAFRESFGGHQH
jgi:cobalt-zinc-cadmium efflux system membrane fusion protein